MDNSNELRFSVPLILENEQVYLLYGDNSDDTVTECGAAVLAGPKGMDLKALWNEFFDPYMNFKNIKEVKKAESHWESVAEAHEVPMVAGMAEWLARNKGFRKLSVVSYQVC